METNQKSHKMDDKSIKHGKEETRRDINAVTDKKKVDSKDSMRMGDDKKKSNPHK